MKNTSDDQQLDLLTKDTAQILSLKNKILKEVEHKDGTENLENKQHEWENKATKVLDELLSYKDLKKVYDEETFRLIESVWKESKATRISKKDLCECLLWIYGKDILSNKDIGKKLRKILAKKVGTEHLGRFCPGKAGAVNFVKKCGLPFEFSGTINKKREPFIILDGQYKLRNLEDYQSEIKKELIAFFQEGKKDRKPSIMSLPTGAGKTRTVVESIHNWIGTIQEDASKDIKSCNLIVWMAQTDELCEQAFIQFNEMWRAKPHKKQVKLVRLWGDFCKDEDKNRISGSIESTEYPVVLITTNKTFESLISNRGEFKMANSDLREKILEHIDLLVIDEAHHASASTYQTCIKEVQAFNGNLLKCRILGITATPFRNDKASPIKDLEKTFPGGLICREYSGVDFKSELQNRGILSKEEYNEWDTNITIKLDEADDFDKEIKKKIDSSTSRNRHRRRKRIAEKIHELFDTNQTQPSMLYFGVSIQDATLMSVLLNIREIKSAVITGETNSSMRERLIRDFKEKRIQVLCNCRVLTAGFDAPQVSHIVLGWKTASPVLFQQIIGRGLRGRKFGGTDVCKIIQAKDQFEGVIPSSFGVDKYKEMWKPAQVYYRKPA